MLFAVLVFTAACKKSPAPVSTRPPEAAAELPMPASRTVETAATPTPAVKDAAMEREFEKRYPGNPAEKQAMRDTMTELDAQLDAEDRLAEIRRRTMVTPAPAGFKPEPVARKVRLKLILEKLKIRAGGCPRFRLEMTNVGREAIDYQEFSSSIFARGGGPLNSPTLFFYNTDSQNKKTELMPKAFSPVACGGLASHRPTPYPSGMSEAEMEKLYQDNNAMGRASATFQVKLLPGETLHSLGDADSPVENFKWLLLNGLRKPGKYRLHVELDDRPEPVTEQRIKDTQSYATPETLRKWHEEEVRAALGPVSSNAVTFEVAR